MPASLMSEIVDQVRSAVLRDGGGLSDGELLELFTRRRDEAALAALVRRHGPMVWGVCRRVLRSHHDAEDAFQATFLVLVRKAAAIQRKDLLANWLFGVAQQTAVRARAMAVKHGTREKQVNELPEPAQPDADPWDSLLPLLDEEVSRLPEKYRRLIVLCDLEGKTRKEAASQLACPEGTVAGRLARARAMLANRLARRGVAVLGGVLGAILTNQAAASAPPALVSKTIHAASLFAAGQATAAGAISAKAVALSEGVMKVMLLAKLKTAFALLVAVGLLALAGGAYHVAPANESAQPQAAVVADDSQDAALAQRGQPKDGTILKGKLGGFDVKNRSVTLVVSKFDRKAGEATEMEHVLNVPKNAVILQDGVKTALADVKTGWPTTVKVEQKNAVSITIEGSTIRGKFKSINVERNTITVIAGRDMGEKIFHLLKTTQVTKAGGKAGKVQDLNAGDDLLLTLSVAGDNTVIRIAPAAAPVEKKRKGR